MPAGIRLVKTSDSPDYYLCGEALAISLYPISSVHGRTLPTSASSLFPLLPAPVLLPYPAEEHPMLLDLKIESTALLLIYGSYLTMESNSSRMGRKGCETNLT